MSAPHWNAILHDVEMAPKYACVGGAKLTTDQVQKLESVEHAATEYGDSILYGLSAVGELLVRTAESGELTKDLAMSTGWLVDNLARLAGALYLQGSAANYKLNKLKREEAQS
ncbi:hypothetical protein [Pseudomonas sp. MWU12-2345]|uniref:hypothetical protein n=1 Tax=Pseudomonas sp. MWU12-2345 TaxID=2928689 RepID=UPI00200C4D7F|nr:hypothetical protein [Pseudomonas sp. MWU12-2345]